MHILAPLLLALTIAGCKQPQPPPPPPAEKDVLAAGFDAAPDPLEPPLTEEPAAQEPGAGDGGTADAAGEVQVEVPPKGFPRFKLCTQSEESGPVDFKHRKHQKQFPCKRCHHEIEKDQKPAACNTCHGVEEDVEKEICDLKTGYHKTCSPCHNSMGMGPVKCVECHKWVKKKKKTEDE